MDINPPYSPEVKAAAGGSPDEKTQKESSKIKGDLVLERWQKLAGLIK
jgi:hypothetical protein